MTVEQSPARRVDPAETLRLDEHFRFRGDVVRHGVIGSGPPLVLLHGTPFSSQVWRRIAPHLAEGRTVYYFDLLGYGQSQKRSGQDVSLGVQNQLFASLLDHWGLNQPDVIAHDFGGATALRTAILNQVRYRSLLLIDPVALSPWGSSLVQHVRLHEQAFALAPAYMHEAILPAYLAGAAARELTPAVTALHMAPWLGSEGQAAFYRQIGQMDAKYTDEVEKRYAELTCPVMIVWGEQDRWIPVERGAELAARIRGSRFTKVPFAGHLVQEDAPEALVALALRWLDRPPV